MRRTIWCSVVAAALVTAACGRGARTEENIRKALNEANMPAVQVELDDEADIVHLQGTVETMADRTRAEEIATAVVGTSGRVLNELTVQGLNDRTTDDFDDQISDTLERMVDDDPALRDREINFEVANGMVAITGTVRTVEEKNRIEQLTRGAPGVKEVANGLQIRAER